MSDLIWLDTKSASVIARRHVDTIRKACESGELHASQRKAGGRWRIHRDCLDSWLGGDDCERHGAGAA